MAVVESSEFKMSSIHQEMVTINKKLSVLLSLIRKIIEQDSKPADQQKGGTACAHQSKAAKHSTSHVAPDPPNISE